MKNEVWMCVSYDPIEPSVYIESFSKTKEGCDCSRTDAAYKNVFQLYPNTKTAGEIRNWLTLCGVPFDTAKSATEEILKEILKICRE